MIREWLCIGVVGLVGCGSDAQNTSSGGGAGAQASTSGSGGSSSVTGTGTGASTGPGGAGGAGGSGCNPACSAGLECCNGMCVNKGNDIKNCGSCGNTCMGATPFCNGGTCGDPPCDPGGAKCMAGQFCCASECCDTGMLCCVVPQGDVGPAKCVKPNDNGTCDPGCPACVCASPDTPIATPHGDRPIADIAVGDLVYSVDGGGVRAVRVMRVNRVPVSNHHVVHVVLDSGRGFDMSPRHPTADGKTVGDVTAGDELHGQRVVSVETVPYRHAFTYDILPASDTGAYFASGALVGSTLGGDARLVPDASLGPDDPIAAEATLR